MHTLGMIGILSIHPLTSLPDTHDSFSHILYILFSSPHFLKSIPLSSKLPDYFVSILYSDLEAALCRGNMWTTLVRHFELWLSYGSNQAKPRTKLCPHLPPTVLWGEIKVFFYLARNRLFHLLQDIQRWIPVSVMTSKISRYRINERGTIVFRRVKSEISLLP